MTNRHRRARRRVPVRTTLCVGIALNKGRYLANTVCKAVCRSRIVRHMWTTWRERSTCYYTSPMSH